jgi:hypothetical protein
MPGRRDDVPIPLMEQTSVSGTANPPRSRKSRAADCIEKAIAENRPLPLEVVLDVMWFFNDAAHRLEVSGEPDDARLSRFARYLALRAAAVALPYVHARIASAAATEFEDGDSAAEDHFARSDRLLEWRLKKLSVAKLHALWDRIKAGDSCDVVLSEMTGTHSIQ